MGSKSSKSILDIPYVSNGNDRQVVDLFLPSSGHFSTRPLAIFIHGGAWVSESRHDHRETAKRLCEDASIAVAVVDYRISVKYPDKDQDIFHPSHLEDVFSALKYLVLERQEKEYQNDNIHIFGHSVGAYMTAAACLSRGAGSIMPELDSKVRRAVRSWILVDGIFSLSTLLEEYPTYTSFVSQAFNSPTGQEFPTPFSSSTKKLLSDSSIESWSLATGQDQAPYFSRQNGTGQFPRVYFLHSKDDELLTFRQTLTGIKRMIKTIEENSNEKLSLQPVTFPKDGIAAVSEEEMSESRMLPSFVNVDLVSLKGSHAEQIQTSAYTDLIASIIKKEYD